MKLPIRCPKFGFPSDHSSPRSFLAALALTAGVLILTILPSSARGALPRETRSFDVPSGEASVTLRQFAQQADQQVVYASQDVKGVITVALKGEYRIHEGINLMLAGTGLVAVFDERSGTFAVSRIPAPKNQRPVPVMKSSIKEDGQTPGLGTGFTNELVTMEDYAVTGSRILLHAGEQPSQPVISFSSSEIERLGVTSLGELFQYIPAVTSATTGIGMETNNGSSVSGALSAPTARTSVQLRGGTEAGTLLLVDGKRVPLTAQKNAGGVGFDLGGIPLSAVDRVEVLLDGASAIYGADAIYGVVNVILKKHYSGTELNFNYDNTFNKDAGIKTVSLTHGFSSGKWSGLFTLSGSNNTVMLLSDRSISATFNRTLYGGSVDSSQPTVYAGGSGSLKVASGNLPGLSTNIVSIPPGSNGQNLTVAQFAAAPAPVAGVLPGAESAMNYDTLKNAYFRLAYDVNDKIQLSAYARIGEDRESDNGNYRLLSNVTLAAGYPGNPFGVPVILSKTFYDLPKVYRRESIINDEFAFTADGKLPGGWRWEVSANYVRGVSDGIPTLLPGANNAIATTTFSSSILNAQIAAGNKPTLIYDSTTQSPNTPGSLDMFWAYASPSLDDEVSQTLTYSAQADGKVISLPAGDLHLLLGAEYRGEFIKFPGSIGLTAWSSIPHRMVTSEFIEARVPIFSPKNKVPLLERLDLTLAGRAEKYSDVGNSETPRYGVAWRPFSRLLLRASYGQGFLVPPLYRTSPVNTTISGLTWTATSNAIDPLRGNQNLTGQPYYAVSGGNPNLKPEKSENWTYGGVLDVPKVRGLSLSFDMFDNKFKDNFGGPSDLYNRILDAPWTVFRGPNLSTDPAGWPGPVIGYDARVINISRSESAGYDFGVSLRRSTAWGDFVVSSTGEKMLKDVQTIQPGAAPTATINKKYDPMRVMNMVTWSRAATELGITNVYGGRYWVDTTNATLSPSRYTASVMRWDASAAYDFSRDKNFRKTGAPWWIRLIGDTKLRATVIDVFNTQPPIDAKGYFSTSVVDLRLRRYVLDLTERF